MGKKVCLRYNVGLHVLISIYFCSRAPTCAPILLLDSFHKMI